MADADFMVGVDLNVVPDGFTKDGNLRLSVVLSPSRLVANARLIDIRHWPSHVNELVASKLRVAAAHITGSVNPDTYADSRDIQFAFAVKILNTTSPAGPNAQALWTRIFRAPGDDEDQGFRNLIGVLDESNSPRAMHVNKKRMASPHAAETAGLLDAIHHNATANILQQNRARQQSRASHAPMPAETAIGVEWWESLHLALGGVITGGDTASWLRSRAAGSGATTPGFFAIDQDMKKAAAWLDIATTAATVLEDGNIARAKLKLLADALGSTAMNTNVWRQGLAEPGSLLTQKALAPSWSQLVTETNRFVHAAGLYHKIEALVEPQNQGERRKLSGIFANPTLARYLGLAIDLEIAVADLNMLSPGAIAVHLPDQAPDQVLLWTAYVLKTDRNYFGPCPRMESVGSPDPNAKIVDGFLNFSASYNHERRFSLNTQDQVSGFLNIARRAAAIHYADVNGLPRDQQATALPELQNRGIGLVDRWVLLDEVREANRKAEIAAKIENNNDPSKNKVTLIKDAEDLLEGYRIDVALAKLSKHPTAKEHCGIDRWRPLMNRDVRYGDIAADFVSDDDRRRQEGHVKPVSGFTLRQIPAPDGDNVLFILPFQDVASWTGESLALQSLSDPKTRAKPDDRATPVYGDYDLAVDIAYDLPKKDGTSSIRQAPPLREGRFYMFAARASFTNGCGRAFDASCYTDTSRILGEDSDTPFAYRRRSRLSPPDVALPHDDRIVRSPIAAWPGESVEHLVIRSRRDGSMTTAHAHRFLIPPRVTFELSEQCGTFDYDDSATPRGALCGRIGLALDKSGALPVATDNKWTFDKPRNSVTRGAVAVLQERPTRPWQDYHPDPWCNGVLAGFWPLDGDFAGFGTMTEAPRFWQDGEQPSDAMPVLLELKGGTGDDRNRGGFDAGDNRAQVPLFQNWSTASVEKLSVWLRPGEIADLKFWSRVDGEALQRHHNVNGGLNILKSFSGDADARAAMLSELAKEGPVATVYPAKTIRLVHAVDRPLGEAPTFLVDNPDQPLNCVSIVLRKGTHDANSSWSDYVAKAGQCGLGDPTWWPPTMQDYLPAFWRGQEGGSSVYFAGRIVADRLTTGQIRCESIWTEYGPDSFRAGSKGWEMAPAPGSARLFSIDDISCDFPVLNAPIDILRDDHGQLRELSYSFADGRARHLKLRLISTSRFTSYFPPDQSKSQVGSYELASADLDAPQFQTWLPCTFRPPPPNIDRILPVFSWNIAASGEFPNDVFSWSREAALRVYMTPDWWASGEGEQLGLVCPPQDADLDKYKDYDNHMTLWGLDPIHHAQNPVSQADGFPVRIPLEAFPTAHILHDLDLMIGNVEPDPTDKFPDGTDAAAVCPIKKPGSKGYEPPVPQLPFDVVAFDPVPDQSEGLFCDIKIDQKLIHQTKQTLSDDMGHEIAYNPFVQLAFVRHQPHALQRLKLSRPTVKWAQLPPSRRGNVTFSSDQSLTFTMSGVGFHASAAGAKAKTSLLNIRLLRAATPKKIPTTPTGEIGWLPVLDDAKNPVQILLLPPVSATAGNEVTWTYNFTLPFTRTSTRYGLLIEEVELLPGDDPEMQIPGMDLVESSPVFSHIIDFGLP